ncbi:hypothetical protein, partial [Pseudoalteromonas undina]
SFSSLSAKKPLSNLLTKRVRDAALLEENKNQANIAKNISLASAGSWLPFSFTSHSLLLVQKIFKQIDYSKPISAAVTS